MTSISLMEMVVMMVLVSMALIPPSPEALVR
jgi:hypothetical protein